MIHPDKNTHKLEELKNQALALMEAAGFSVTAKISVSLDRDLPFMGYTTEKEDGYVIVISGNALSGNMALSLLIHELSHVYHMQTDHPSHDQQLLTAITAWVMHGKAVQPYQEKILHAILNNIQDLYADDISFKIFSKNKPPEKLNEFFLGWIRKTVPSTTPEKRWENAEALLSAAFAEANLKRHHVVDTDAKVAKAIQVFLSNSDKILSTKYEYFKNFMIDIPKKVTEKEFEKLLIGYLNEFLKLTAAPQ